MGTVTAPVRGSGSCPEWMARVAKPKSFFFFMRSEILGYSECPSAAKPAIRGACDGAIKVMPFYKQSRVHPQSKVVFLPNHGLSKPRPSANQARALRQTC